MLDGNADSVHEGRALEGMKFGGVWGCRLQGSPKPSPLDRNPKPSNLEPNPNP